MKHLKRALRICALILFMLLATGGISVSGIAPVLTRDRKLFVDIEAKAENTEKGAQDSSPDGQLNFQETR